MKHWEAVLADAIERLYGARVAGELTRARAATAELALAMGQAGSLYDVAARLGVYRTAGLLVGEPARQAAAAPAVPAVPFEEAFAALMGRVPAGAADAEEVQRVWAGYGFAAARAATAEVAQHVQEVVARGLRDGRSEAQVGAELATDVGWPRSYARMVFRTTVATATTAGRMLSVQDPLVADALPAWEYVTAGDRDVRSGRKQDRGENHAALAGFVAAVGWPGWDEWAPPNGYA